MQNIVLTLRIQSNLGNWSTIFLSYNFLEIFSLTISKSTQKHNAASVPTSQEEAEERADRALIYEPLFDVPSTNGHSNIQTS